MCPFMTLSNTSFCLVPKLLTAVVCGNVLICLIYCYRLTKAKFIMHNVSVSHATSLFSFHLVQQPSARPLLTIAKVINMVVM